MGGRHTGRLAAGPSEVGAIIADYGAPGIAPVRREE